MRDYNLKLDITDSEINIDELWFIKGDIGGYITLELTDDNQVIDLSNSSVIAIFEKKDKTITQKDATILDLENSIVRLDMLNSIIDIPGKVRCFIKIYKGEGVTTFSPFTITVKKSISMDDIIDSYTELDILQIVNRNTDNIISLSEDLENLSAVVTKDIENLNEDLINLTNDSSESIEFLNVNVKKLSDHTVKNLKDLSDGIADVDESLKPIKEDIKNIQDNKANIIISLEEPNHTNLTLGTIWIKPLVQDE